MTSDIREWVIDATSSRDPAGGFLAFCPVERDENGEVSSIVTGLTFLADKPPNDEPCVGVWHEDGEDAAEDWMNSNRAFLPVFSGPQS